MRVTQGLNIIRETIFGGNNFQYGFLILARARLCYPQTNKVARAFLLKSNRKEIKHVTPDEGRGYEKNHNE